MYAAVSVAMRMESGLKHQVRSVTLNLMRVEMLVAGLTIDPVNHAPIVVLKERDGERVLPIWIGVIEASAIAFELEAVTLSRPMTHDLFKTALESLEAAVEHVTVIDLRDGTYYAAITMTHPSRDGSRRLRTELDARPSDAIALALRTQARVYCESEVLERAHRVQDAARRAEEAAEGGETEWGHDAQDEMTLGPRPILATGASDYMDVLERLEPEDFGKYKM